MTGIDHQIDLAHLDSLLVHQFELFQRAILVILPPKVVALALTLLGCLNQRFAFLFPHFALNFLDLHFNDLLINLVVFKTFGCKAFCLANLWFELVLVAWNQICLDLGKDFRLLFKVGFGCNHFVRLLQTQRKELHLGFSVGSGAFHFVSQFEVELKQLVLAVLPQQTH